MSELKAGDVLYFVYGDSRRGDPRFVTIESVGRKWATLVGRNVGRIDKVTLEMDGGKYSSPGRCYRSKEEHDASVQLQTAWGQFRDFVACRYRVPDGITMDQILTAFAAIDQQR